MTNSTNPAESLGTLSAAVSYYRWAVPAKPIAVHLSLDLLDRLERDVLESFKAVTKRGSEIGGVLVGRATPGNPATVTIEQFEPVECEYSRGPLYLLADADKVRLRETIARVESRSDGLTVAGFFRSNTRRELTLDEDDLALAAELFQDPNQVLLLVRPFAMKPSVGGFFIWENGEIHGEESYLQFPFKRPELLKTLPQAIVGPAEKAEAPQPSRGPLVMPKREERTPVAPPAALKREEPKPTAPAPKREEPPALVFKREERPPIIPTTVRREEPTAKRDDRKRDERPSGPTLVTKREEPPAPPVLHKEEKKEEKPAPPVQAKKEEKPAITVKREEKPAAAVVTPAKREEVVPVKPAPAKPEEKAAPAKAEEKTVEKAAPAPVEASARTETAADLSSLFRNVAPETEPVQSGSRKWVFVAVAILLLVGAGYFGYRALNSQTNEAVKPVDSSLALRVERSAGQLLLSWNRAASVIQTATRATLSITDGDHTEPVDLDLGQLRTGSIVYSPMTNDVSFRLEVTDLKSGKSSGESVRVLAGRPSPAVAGVQPSAAKPAPGSTDKPGTPAASAASAPAAPARTEQPKVVAGPAVTAAPPKPESLAARLRAAETQELPAPPTLESGGSSAIGSSAPSMGSAVLAPPPQQAAQTPRPVTQAPKPAAQTPAPAAAAPAAQVAPTGGQAQEARLVRRVSPAYPPLARQTRVSGIVRIRAVIGKDGKVKHAQALSGPPLLRQAAVETVSRWLYSPAMLNGEPVESDTQVDVNFML